MSNICIEKLKKLMQFRPNLRGCADFFNVSEDTISRFIQKKEQLTFSEFKEKYSEGLKLKLQMRAVDLAMSGNVPMMIFCLKNLANWGEQPKAEQTITNIIPLAYVPLSQRAKKIS